MPRRVLVMVLLLMLVCGDDPYAQVPGFSVDVTWAGSKACFDPQSPPFTLGGIPPGTRKLRFTMTDLDAPNFVHGGGLVVYDGQGLISRGAFSYRGPCPPSGPYRYRWTVDAEDAAGHTLATATITKKFPPE
jgi:phosphatidylethanolamine-binding protein (PEBP) family uncharacterized protein